MKERERVGIILTSIIYSIIIIIIIANNKLIIIIPPGRLFLRIPSIPPFCEFKQRQVEIHGGKRASIFRHCNLYVTLDL